MIVTTDLTTTTKVQIKTTDQAKMMIVISITMKIERIVLIATKMNMSITTSRKPKTFKSMVLITIKRTMARRKK